MSICLSVPRESSYNLPPIAGTNLDFDGVYIGPDPTPHLWPPGPRDKAPGSIRSVTAGFGPGLDRGALRRGNAGRWEMLEFGPRWIPWRPGFLDHYLAASAYNRYGVGWSFGPAHNLHDEAYGKWEELCGSPPEPIQKWDVDYSLQLWRQLDSEWRAKFGHTLEPSEPKPSEPVKPQEPTKPIEPKPQEPSMPLPIPVSSQELSDVAVQLKNLRLELKDGIESVLESINHPAEINEHVMIERQWWHHRLSILASEWSIKRPQLARQLTALLEERRLEDE